MSRPTTKALGGIDLLIVDLLVEVGCNVLCVWFAWRGDYVPALLALACVQLRGILVWVRCIAKRGVG